MLRLHAVSHATWERFHAGEITERDASADPVLSRWLRASALGVRSDGAATPIGTTTADVIERRARIDSMLEAHGGLDATPFDLGRGRRMAIFADKDGVIVKAKAQDFDHAATRARLLEGATWSEDARGTNAIGTALRERRGVAVIGPAHYERVNQGLFCYATPILDPYGDLLGVFDVSGDLAEDDPLLATAVLCFGRALESTLRAHAYATAVAGGLRVVERMVDRCAMPTMLIEANGVVRSLNERGRGLGGAPGATVESIFGIGFAELAAEATRGGAIPTFETATARYALNLDPILGQGGRILSLLAYFDPLGTRAEAPPPPSLRPAAPTLHPAFSEIVGTDAAVVRAKTLASRFAPTPVPVLLLAETGTGKELVARAVHAASKRSAGPFVAINCGALTEALLQSELFGFAAGSFTGARAGGHEGKLAAADGGTLFLDEIGEMSPALQAMLLRVLEDGTYSRIGESQPRKSDFRLVCATCRDLPQMVGDGRFRSDLFYRIHGASIVLPPLRKRTDRALLSDALVAILAREASLDVPSLTADARKHVEAHSWPGNVRELKAALRHALYLAEGGVVDATCFPEILVVQEPTEEPVRTRRDAESEALSAALTRTGGNLSETARQLGVSRSTLYRMMARRGR